MVDNIPPRDVWAAVQSDPRAQVVDVRTDAEWTYVGLVDLQAAGKQPVLIPWQIFPAMQVNGAFLDQFRAAARKQAVGEGKGEGGGAVHGRSRTRIEPRLPVFA